MALEVPLQAVPSQQLQIVLGGQNCQIAVYLIGAALFVDLNSNNTDISTAVLALNGIVLVPTVYFGFEGNLVFVDTQGTSDPTYDGLGSRYQLMYVTEADYVSIVV